MKRNSIRTAALPLALALTLTADLGFAGGGDYEKYATGPDAVAKLFETIHST